MAPTSIGCCTCQHEPSTIPCRRLQQVKQKHSYETLVMPQRQQGPRLRTRLYNTQPNKVQKGAIIFENLALRASDHSLSRLRQLQNAQIGLDCTCVMVQ